VHPEISIIIAAHDNSTRSLRTLESLSRQTIDPERFEVIVVPCGCEEQTVAAMKSLSLPYMLTLLDKPCSNLATARNRGGQAATGRMLMFLEDDIEASEFLVAAHIRAHEMHPGGVILGYFPLGQDLERYDIFADITRLEWSEIFTSQRDPSHRFDFRDMNNTNISVQRDLFISVGGYDENFSACEDLELGVRLLEQQVRFYFVPDAVCVHYPTLSEADLFQRKVAEGRAHVQLLRKHPELRAFFVLGYDAHIRSRNKYNLTKLSRNPLFYQTAHDLILSCLRLTLISAKALKLRATYYKILIYIIEYSYWKGVLLELGSFESLKKFIKDFPEDIFRYNEIGIDLKKDWKLLDKLLGERPVDAAVLRHGEIPIGYIVPVAGAESLRPSHIQDALIHRFASESLGIIHQDVRKVVPRFVLAQGYLQSDAFHAPIILFDMYKCKLYNHSAKFIPLIAGAWHKIEYENGIPFRWLEGDACLFIYSKESGIAAISFQTQAFYRPRRLKIIINGLILRRWIIQLEPERIMFSADLSQGINIIDLHIVEGMERPCDIPELHVRDDRPMSVSMKGLKIVDIDSVEIDPIFSISEKYKKILFIILLDGWFKPEVSEGHTRRWIGKAAACELYLKDRCRFELSLRASSFYRPRTLEIFAGDSLLSRSIIPTDLTTVKVSIELERGNHFIRFYVPEGCEKPSTKRKFRSDDSRCLSISLQNINIV
jgi:GT2 family glycosyltransferase